jgi:thiaminase/transcriptional activator TenA
VSSTSSERLRERANEIWEAQHSHPFVRGIADGTLPPERFRMWMRQDYLFLIDYGRMLAYAAARAPDLATMRRMAELTYSTLEGEMDLHRSYAAELGISATELEGEEMAPTTRAYTDFLVRSAAAGDFAELLAALLPCMWGYNEIGERLAQRPPPDEQAYAKWIEIYSSEEFAQLARWCRELMDEAGASLSSGAERRVEDAFLTSSRYELAFWEMAWVLESWPV